MSLSDFETTSSVTLTHSSVNYHDGDRVPPGGIVCHSRWQGTEVATTLQGRVRLIFEDDMGVVDFYTSHDKAVIYISEADLITNSSHRKKLAKVRKAKKLKGTVLVEKTAMTGQYFLDVQKFVVIELGFILLPVTSQVEAGNLLVQMVNEENKPNVNPFMAKVKKDTYRDQAILTTVQMIPKLGSVKAKALLNRFKSIHGIQAATIHELSDVVGKANAHHVQTFFEEKRKVR